MLKHLHSAGLDIPLPEYLKCLPTRPRCKKEAFHSQKSSHPHMTMHACPINVLLTARQQWNLNRSEVATEQRKRERESPSLRWATLGTVPISPGQFYISLLFRVPPLVLSLLSSIVNRLPPDWTEYITTLPPCQVCQSVEPSVCLLFANWGQYSVNIQSWADTQKMQLSYTAVCLLNSCTLCTQYRTDLTTCTPKMTK